MNESLSLRYQNALLPSSLYHNNCKSNKKEGEQRRENPDECRCEGRAICPHGGSCAMAATSHHQRGCEFSLFASSILSDVVWHSQTHALSLSLFQITSSLCICTRHWEYAVCSPFCGESDTLEWIRIWDFAHIRN